MEYEIGLRLDRLEYKLDILLEAAGVTEKTAEKTPEKEDKRKKVKDDL